ncbi:MAG: glycosyltransferase family 4 protein [Gammaproteobacteria bacterium]
MLEGRRGKLSRNDPTKGKQNGCKVLYVVGYYRTFTGSQRSLSLLVEHLPVEVQATVMLTGEGRATAALRARGVNTVVLPVPPRLDAYEGKVLQSTTVATRLRYAADALAYSRRVWRFLRSERPDVVHCNDSRALLLTGWAARALRIPVVWHLRGFNPLSEMRALDMVAQRLASAIIIVADAVKPERLRRGLSCITIYNGIPASGMVRSSGKMVVDRAIADAGFSPSRTKRVLIASSLTPYKGHHHLLYAIASLISRNVEPADRLVCLVLGAESSPREKRYGEYLRSLAEKLNITQNLLWIGWQDDVEPWMHGADVVAVPTVESEVLAYSDGEQEAVRCLEGFPRTILEAMRAGRASVASDVAGVREAVDDGVTGIVVPPSDPTALAGALERLLGDAERRREMESHARARADLFDISKTVTHTLDLYRLLLRAP